MDAGRYDEPRRFDHETRAGTLAPPRPKPPEPRPVQPYPGPIEQVPRGSVILSWLRTTDAKQIGLMYLVTSYIFFLAGGVLALLMRAELARPGLQFLSTEQYNQLFTMHRTIM